MITKEQFLSLEVGNTLEVEPLLPGLSQENTVLQVLKIKKDGDQANKLVHMSAHYFNTKIGDLVLTTSSEGKVISQGGALS